MPAHDRPKKFEGLCEALENARNSEYGEITLGVHLKFGIEVMIRSTEVKRLLDSAIKIAEENSMQLYYLDYCSQKEIQIEEKKFALMASLVGNTLSDPQLIQAARDMLAAESPEVRANVERIAGLDSEIKLLCQELREDMDDLECIAYEIEYDDDTRWYHIQEEANEKAFEDNNNILKLKKERLNTMRPLVMSRVSSLAAFSERCQMSYIASLFKWIASRLSDLSLEPEKDLADAEYGLKTYGHVLSSRYSDLHVSELCSVDDAFIQERVMQGLENAGSEASLQTVGLAPVLCRLKDTGNSLSSSAEFDDAIAEFCSTVREQASVIRTLLTEADEILRDTRKGMDKMADVDDLDNDWPGSSNLCVCFNMSGYERSVPSSDVSRLENCINEINSVLDAKTFKTSRCDMKGSG